MDWSLGPCMVAGGHVWLLGGMHGSRGVCIVVGGACVVAGEHAWLPGGLCVDMTRYGQ